jgi:hypothetical protein
MAKKIKLMSPQAVGAFGESAVICELLRRGWIPANVNATVKNAAKFDIYALRESRTVHLRVRACGPTMDGEFQFGGYAVDKPIADIPFEESDFTVLVQVGADRAQDDFYVVPSRVVHQEVRRRREQWLSQAKRDGGARQDRGFWTLRLRSRQDGEAGPGWGLAQKWKKYHRAWQELE